jgi:hypothetical protein
MLNKILDYSIISPNIRIKREDKNYTHVIVKGSPQRIKIPKKLNKELIYLFGAIVGDGHLSLIYRKNEKYPVLKLGIYNNSKKYLEKLNIIFIKEFNQALRIYKKKGNNCFALETGNKLIWLFFHKHLNIKNKKINLQVPKEIRDKNLFKYFLAGLFDTDGYYSETFGIMLGGTHYELLDHIKELSQQYHGIKFLGPRMNILRTNGKTYKRCYMKTSTYSNHKFRKVIPLMHEKYMSPPGFEPGTTTL